MIIRIIKENKFRKSQSFDNKLYYKLYYYFLPTGLQVGVGNSVRQQLGQTCSNNSLIFCQSYFPLIFFSSLNILSDCKFLQFLFCLNEKKAKCSVNALTEFKSRLLLGEEEETKKMVLCSS